LTSRFPRFLQFMVDMSELNGGGFGVITVRRSVELVPEWARGGGQLNTGRIERTNRKGSHASGAHCGCRSRRPLPGTTPAGHRLRGRMTAMGSKAPLQRLALPADLRPGPGAGTDSVAASQRLTVVRIGSFHFMAGATK